MSSRDTFYFPHEYNAKDDPKCERLIFEMGMEGYGIFWSLLEVLRAQPDYTYPLENIPLVAYKYRTDSEKVRRVVFDFGLFNVVDDKIFFSNGLIRRMQPMDQRRHKQSEGGKEGAKKRWENGGKNSLPNGYPINLPNGYPYSNKSRVNKMREEESKRDCKGGDAIPESNDASASTNAGGSAPAPHKYSESFLKFQQWVTDNAPRVAKMKEPMTEEQSQKLKDKYPTEQICEVLQAMHNYEPLIRRNRSAYLTASNWLRRQNQTTTLANHETKRTYQDL